MSERSPFKPIRSLTGRVRRRTPTTPGASLAVERIGDRISMVDSAVYVAGDRVDSPETLGDTFRSLREHEGSVAWIGLYRPDQHELGSLAQEFDLHELAVEDAIVAHQRPKLERYDNSLFTVFKTIRYVEHAELTATSEVVESGEVMVFTGRYFVITASSAMPPMHVPMKVAAMIGSCSMGIASQARRPVIGEWGTVLVSKAME